MAAFSHIPVLALLVLSAFFTVAADVAAKYWSIERGAALYAAAIILYAVGTVFFIQTLLSETLIVSATLWTVLSTLGFILASILLFRETITPIQWVGVGLGVASVVLLSVHGH